MASMSQISISESVDVIVQTIQESVMANEINENVTDSVYFYVLNDCDDCEPNVPTDLQKLIEKENVLVCKIVEETLTFNLGNENIPQNVFIGSSLNADEKN